MGTVKSNSSNFLFSKVQKLILKLLYLNDNSDFNTNEIIRKTNCGTGVVQRELSKFTDAGIIVVKQVGNQKRYQANQSLPYYSELRSIIIKTFGLAEHLADEINILLTKQIKIAFIYGSFAKQTDNAMSDIDLMLIGNDLTYADFYHKLTEIELSLGRKINPSIYTTLEWIQKSKDNNFIIKVMEGPKIFLKGSEDELKKLTQMS